MTFKELTLEDLKRDYGSRHGFVFVGHGPSDKTNCAKLTQQLITCKITEVEPEFIVQLNDGTFTFVYPEGCAFESGRFFEVSTTLGHMTGRFKIDMLAAFLKNN